MNKGHEKPEEKLELLAPAGGWDAFKAAIENGADAVYLGGKRFGARAGAANFEDEELERAVDYAHDRQAKVYVTVNTIIADQEFDKLAEYIFKLYQMGVDAVLLQDIGVVYMLRSILPELEIHASTQMTVNTSWGVKALEEMGFYRAVLARETSAEEMKEISQRTHAEIEVFIHGALCICYSGQCLMSSFIGGRSGNRGTCAQPCRMAYQLVNSNKENTLKGLAVGEHLLSPRDLNLIDHLAVLKKAGVKSLKIEGRMKRPEYVATVTRIYRRELDLLEQNEGEKDINASLSEEERYELTQIFNRDFTSGYLFSHPGANLMSYARPNNRGTRLGRIVGLKSGLIELKLENRFNLGDGIEIWTGRGREGATVEEIRQDGVSVTEARQGQVVQIFFPAPVQMGDRVFKTNDALLMEKARITFQDGKEQRKRPLTMELRGTVGEKLILEGRSGDRHALVYSETEAQQALKRPLTNEYAKEHLNRLGNTPFELSAFTFDVQGEAMLPVRELNEMRRALVEELLARNVSTLKVNQYEYDLRVREWKEKCRQAKGNFSRPKLTVAVGDPAGLEAALKGGAEQVIFGGEHWRSKQGFSFSEIQEGVKLCREQNVEGIWSLPRILNEKQSQALYRQLKEWREMEERPLIMAANLGEMAMLKELVPGYPFLADYSFNIFNQAGMVYLTEQGARQITLSPELHYEQIKGMVPFGQAEILVFGDLEMMVSEYCPIGAALGGKKGPECSRPCTKERYFLRDRFQYDFPIETDLECRMHLYNVKKLNLYQDLDKLISLSPASLRLQLNTTAPEAIRQIVPIFKQGIIRASKGLIEKDGQDMAKLEKLFPQGFTKGHFYRGILG